MASKDKNASLIEHAKKFENTPWCDDYEKMISGMLYNSLVPELRDGRLRARKLIKRYNDYLPNESTEASLIAGREEILKELIGNLGTGVFIDPPFRVDYGCNVSLGDGFYANFNLVILDCGIVEIGARTMFGPNVSIYAATHETEVDSRRQNIEYAREVTIGSDCWIGGNTVILPGVKIGNGVTIGASSVVSRSIPDFSVAIGSPARVIKKVNPVPDMP